MSLKRITISVPEHIAQKAARAAEAGQVESVSAYFVQLADREPDWVEASVAVEQMIAEIGGLSAEETSWARAVLGVGDGDSTEAA